MLVTITGPTCSGKSTLEKALTERSLFGKLVSFTTRRPRVGEQEGQDYFFTNSCPPDEDLVEKVEFNGQFYGLYKSQVNNAKNKLMAVVVEPGGVVQLEKYCRENGIVIFKVFLYPTYKTLVSRFLNRFWQDVSSYNFDHYVSRFISLQDEMLWVEMNNWDLVLTPSLNEDIETMVKTIFERLYEVGYDIRKT